MAVDKTFVIKGTPDAEWILMDAANQGIGRLATQIRLLPDGQTQANIHAWRANGRLCGGDQCRSAPDPRQAPGC